MAMATDEGGGSKEGRPPNIVISGIDNVRTVAIKAKEETKHNLCKLGPFAISKYLDYIVQEPGSTSGNGSGSRRGTHDRHDNSRRNQNKQPDTPLITYIPQHRTGTLLIKTTNDKQTQLILKAKRFGDIDIVTSIPIGPNTCRGVVNVYGFRDLSEETLIKELKSQNVIGVRHFRRKTEGEYTNTNTVTLTFQSTTLPREIRAGYLIAEVKPFIQRPRKCFKCQKYGHITKWCRADTNTCGKCAQPHETQTCDTPEQNYVCAVCPDNAKHASTDKDCPTYIFQKQVCEIMSIKNIPFPEARKQATPMKRSYATAAKKSNCTCICTCQKQEIPETTPTHSSMPHLETSKKSETIPQPFTISSSNLEDKDTEESDMEEEGDMDEMTGFTKAPSQVFHNKYTNKQQVEKSKSSSTRDPSEHRHQHKNKSSNKQPDTPGKQVKPSSKRETSSDSIEKLENQKKQQKN